MIYYFSYFPQVLTEASISPEQSLNFRIIIKLLIYRSIFICSNAIYNILIFEQSYENLRQNVSHIFWCFDLYMISWTVLIINQSIIWTRLIFFLCFIRLYINDQTIIQPKKNIIIIQLFRCLVINLWSPSKGKSSKSEFW